MNDEGYSNDFDEKRKKNEEQEEQKMKKDRGKKIQMSTVKFVQLQFEELCVFLLLLKTLCLASALTEKHNKVREFSEALSSSS